MTNPDLLTIDPSEPSSAVIERAVLALESGALVVAPTETRYGILALVSREDAVRRLYDLKGRHHDQPTALFVGHPDEIENLAVVNDTARLLISEFLPGPLTLVLPAKEELGEPIVIDGLVGVRCSSALLIGSILEGVSGPLTATSANLSGGADNETIAQVQSDFGHGVDMYIDGGSLAGQTSTVVKCVGSDTVVLREGAISRADLDQLVSSL